MDVILNHCQACLSTDRVLHSLESLEGLLQNASLWELISVRGGICWECLGTITKFVRFRNQIYKSQELLHNTEEPQTLQSLSPLKAILNLSNEIYIKYEYSSIREEDKIIEGKQTIDNNDNKTYIEVNIKDEINTTSADNTDKEDYPEEEHKEKPNEKICIEKLKTTKVKKLNRKKFKKASVVEEVSVKFTKVVFTEEQMLRNREDKMYQPNYMKIPFKCDLCVLGFTRKDTYDLHMDQKHHESAGNLICPVCQRRFPSEKKFERHKKKHYTSYRCKLCKYETAEMWSAYLHCESKHEGDEIDKIHCSCCHFVAKSPEELAAHTSSEHHIYCNECGKKFKSKASLRTHIMRIHKVKREFICDICNKTFKTKSRLETHLVTHNAMLAQKLSYCAQCKVQYKNIYVYRSHLRTSAGHAQEGYECEACNKKFVSKVYLKQHYNFYHLHKSPFRCELCDKIFISEWRLKNHRQTQHGLSRTRDHSCNVCGKQFYTKTTLKGHELTHSVERKFMCEDCGDTFKQRPALYTHCKLVHRDVKRVKKQTLVPTT